MAHFAKIENGIVQCVVVVDNKMITSNGQESEAAGIEYLRRVFNDNATWIQTSYNGNKRKNYAARGYTYDADRDAFIPPKPHASWTLDEHTCRWKSPKPHPGDRPRSWSEEAQEWI